MFKKVIRVALSFGILFTLLVMPAHSASFSHNNYTQYIGGFYTNNDDMIINTSSTNVDGIDYVTYAKATGDGTKVLAADRNPIAYKNSNVNNGPSGKFAHMRFYISAFSDEYRTTMKTIQIRMDKDGTGASRNTFLLDGVNSQAYPEYTNSATYLDRHNRTGVWKMGKDYGTSAQAIIPDDEDFHKIDIIADLNGIKARTTYMFIDGEFMGCYYDSGMPTGHFYGMLLRVLKNTKLRANCYMAARFDNDRIGHREYYDTADYKVTFEDVLQDAGLGNEVDDSSVIYQTSKLSNYMPGASHCAKIYSESESDNILINDKVSYVGTAACISNSSDRLVKVADMLAGMIPQRDGFGLGYVNYAPRAKFIRLSYNQTIYGSNTMVEYDLYSTGANKAFQLWNNDGKMVVGLRGSDINVTTMADYEGSNRIDWVLEPSTKMQYLFINGKYVSKGDMGLDRIQNILIQMNGLGSSLKLDSWTMTMYNDLKTFEELSFDITGTLAYWVDDLEQNSIVLDGDHNKMTVLATAKLRDGVEQPDSFINAKIITAIYDADGRFMDMRINKFLDGVTIGKEIGDNTFDLNKYDTVPQNVKSILITTEALTPWSECYLLGVE